MGRAPASRGRTEVGEAVPLPSVIPLPVSIEASAAAPFVLTGGVIVTGSTDAAA